MKLHDLRPAAGAHTAKTRVGRGIAAGKGKTAGRGTKGQKSRTGGRIAAWFEGGQTPIHIRIPKLRGFRNRGKIEYEVVNLGRISQLVELGAFSPGDMPATTGRSGKTAPITINQEILRAAGLVSTLNKPLKVLGQGEVTVPLFVVADAFSRSAVAKIEAAGGSVQALEVPSSPMAALTGEPAVAGGGAAAPSAATARAEAAPAAPSRRAKAEPPTAKAEPPAALAEPAAAVAEPPAADAAAPAAAVAEAPAAVAEPADPAPADDTASAQVATEAEDAPAPPRRTRRAPAAPSEPTGEAG